MEVTVKLTSNLEAEDGPCKEFKHHFEECQKRVMNEMEEEGYAEKAYKEDCVEEL